jgi:hypothetical protein
MRKSRLSWSIQRRLIEHFVAGATARTASGITTLEQALPNNFPLGTDKWDEQVFRNGARLFP